jgi:dihydrofolate synthase / folylpolyglutamate synthase
LNTIALKRYLKHHQEPQKTYKTIHIGGSNGKGSTSFFLAQMLIQQGMKVGFYFSPYTMERFDNILVQNQEILNIETTFKELEESMILEGLTSFEQDTALAFLMFKKYQVDVAVIEVGLGGTHDATNVLDASLAIITSTSLEHDEIIGPTIKDIATHQAGIIHKGMQVLLSSQLSHDILPIFLNRIEAVGAQLIFPHIPKLEHHFPTYQNNNLKLAYQALLTMHPHPQIDISMLKLMPFRFQYMHDHLIFDGAHNLEGIEALIQSLQNKAIQPVVYMSILKTKKYVQMLQIMAQYAKKVYVTSFEHEDSIQLSNIKHIKDVFWIDFKEMITHLNRTNYDTIVLTGSLYFLRSVKKTLHF